MGYRPFYKPVLETTPATFATFRGRGQSNVANVASPIPETKNGTAPETAHEPRPIAKPIASAGLSIEDQNAAYEERAGNPGI
jgi:hypothetical protein